ncbi:hypothetical protein DYB28_012606, partial [Aphanomyces astaci]
IKTRGLEVYKGINQFAKEVTVFNGGAITKPPRNTTKAPGPTTAPPDGCKKCQMCYYHKWDSCFTDFTKDDCDHYNSEYGTVWYNCGVTVEMADERKKRKANEIAEDADDSVEEAEVPAQQVEVVDLTADSDYDGGVAPSEDAVEVAQRNADWEAKAALNRERLGQLEQQVAADLVKSAMQTVGAEGVQKLLEQHLARDEAAKMAREAEEVKAKARRAEEAKTIAAASAKAADEAAKEAAEAARKVTSEGVTGTPSGEGGHPNATGTEAKVKAEHVGPERTGLARDEVFERELGFHGDRSRIFTPAGWGGVDLEYVRNVTRHLTVLREFDETREDWGYQVANAAGVARYLRLFASAQSFELRVMWMLLAMECMQLARVSFHRFDEFKGAMRELHERERLERWTVDVG